eukprot:scaffold5892_cov56-Phaeocystis_antarctica.AAC.3
MWDLGDVLDLSCWQEGGLWGRGGREAAKRVLGVALVMWGELGRGGGTPPVTLRKIGGGHCEELLLRQKHSGHVVAEAHLTVVRARCARVQRQEQMQWVESMDMHIGVECGARGGGPYPLRRRDHRAGAALLEPGAETGDRLDLLDGGVGLAHALVAQPKLLAAAARRSRRRELQVVSGRQHCGREGRRIAPERQEQHESGKEDADDAVEAWGGLLRLLLGRLVPDRLLHGRPGPMLCSGVLSRLIRRRRRRFHCILFGIGLLHSRLLQCLLLRPNSCLLRRQFRCLLRGHHCFIPLVVVVEVLGDFDCAEHVVSSEDTVALGSGGKAGAAGARVCLDSSPG